jgi:7-cyano-7-deazaguanine synthase in queuosine biosynthesis
MLIISKDKKQQINFEIPLKFKKIAVNISGGADSAILLYMLIKYLQENNRNDVEVNAITCNGEKKGRRNVQYAVNVVNTVLDLTNFHNFNMHYVYYRPDQDYKYAREVETDLLDKQLIDLVCTGLTCNPYSHDTKVVDASGNVVDLTTDALVSRNGTKHRKWSINHFRNFYHPFANVDKRMIADLYEHFNVTDLLFTQTRSCEALPDHKWYTEEGTKQPCGNCWWCLERKWAFGKI